MKQQKPTPGGFQSSHDHGNCKAALALAMIQSRWKLLKAHLRDLDAEGVVMRTVHAQVLPQVDDALTELSRELIPVLNNLHAFGEQVGRNR